MVVPGIKTSKPARAHFKRGGVEQVGPHRLMKGGHFHANRRGPTAGGGTTRWGWGGGVVNDDIAGISFFCSGIQDGPKVEVSVADLAADADLQQQLLETQDRGFA